MAWSVVLWYAFERRHHVIVVSARVIVGDKEGRLHPTWPSSHSLVYVLQKPLSLGDIMAWVVARLLRR